MKNFFLLVALAAACALIYLALAGDLAPRSGEGGKPRPKDTVQKVMDSGRNMGESAGKAFEKVGFGGW